MKFILRAVAITLPFLLAACGGANSEAPKTPSGANDAPTVAKPAKTKADILPDDMILGDADAPVSVIEYASVTCPGCAAFHSTTLPKIKEKYIDTGKVNLVFREFPTPPVEFSFIGSVLARCAAEKSDPKAYFVVIDALMKNQRTWIYGEDPKLELLKIVSQVGMDEEGFNACLKRQELVDAMNVRIEKGRNKYEIQSTPSFVVDGKKVQMRSFEEFSKVLDEKLGIEPTQD